MYTYVYISNVSVGYECNLITVCPIKGQVRSECASHPSCHQTCTSTGPTPCPAICIVNGCECPNGTVIDEAKKECVPRRECEGKLETEITKTCILYIMSVLTTA